MLISNLTSRHCTTSTLRHFKVVLDQKVSLKNYTQRAQLTTWAFPNKLRCGFATWIYQASRDQDNTMGQFLIGRGDGASDEDSREEEKPLQAESDTSSWSEEDTARGQECLRLKINI